MGKTRDLFKKIKRNQGNISCKDGHNKGQKWYGSNRNRRYEEEVATIYRRTIQKYLNDPDNHSGVTTHREPVKWALGSITMNKASGGDGIPAELFQILKDDAVKVLYSICQQIGKLISGHRTGKGQFSFQSQRKAMPKNAQTTAQLHSPHMLVK